MTKSQTKKLFSIEGTKRLRKQWQRAIVKGKTPNSQSFLRMPNFNPARIKLTIEERILNRINAKLSRMAA